MFPAEPVINIKRLMNWKDAWELSGDCDSQIRGKVCVQGELVMNQGEH